MKVSMMGCGEPILKDNKGYWQLPSDRRLSKGEAKELNDKEELETIALQKRLLEIEAQREIDLWASKRDSYSLYDEDEIILGNLDYEEYIEQEFPNFDEW